MADPSKPLPNPRHERFAQGLACGLTGEQAYAAAGYRQHSGNASRLSANEAVEHRVSHLQLQVASMSQVTRESLLVELEAARRHAMVRGQSAAAVSATLGKAKLAGLLVDKHQHAGPNGGPLQTLDLSNLTTEQLEVLEKLYGPLAAREAADEGSSRT